MCLAEIRRTRDKQWFTVSSHHGQNSTSGQILTPNWKSPWAVSYSNTNFGGTSPTIYTCFERKTAFVMQHFRNLGQWDGVKIFWRNPQKANPWPISRIFSHWSCKSVQGFFLQAWPRKTGHYKKSQRGYISPLQGIPHPTKFNWNWRLSRGRRRNQLTKFGNDRSRKCVMEGQILPCSIEMACHCSTSVLALHVI